MHVPARVVDALLDRMEGDGDYKPNGDKKWRCTECGTITGDIDAPGERMNHEKDCAVRILEEYARRMHPVRERARTQRNLRAADAFDAEA